MRILQGARLPVHTWADDLEDGAGRQARNCADMPVAFHHVAVMADGHQGYGVPIGAVLALDSAIAPYAVGNDIGCGVAVVPTDLHRDDVLAPGRNGAQPLRDRVMSTIQREIPADRGGSEARGADDLLEQAWQAIAESARVTGLPATTAQGVDARSGSALSREELFRRGRAQLGTLGAGNHFLEMLSGPDGDVWLMLHSGSRGVGSLVCAHFHRIAVAHCRATGQPPPDPGLAWLPINAGEGPWQAAGRLYERALHAALGYAERNRSRMLDIAGAAVERLAPGAVRGGEAVSIHHNDATLEEHFGRPLWVHRKGAVKASLGTTTIIPGSMGTGSYLGRGLGNPDAFMSCSHGAGRRLSRTRARHDLSLQRELAAVGAAGGKVFATRTDAVLDEMPGAYKDLDAVMRAQADLVEPVRRLTPLATYKGSEPPRSRRGGWRPGEER